jgi:hypothetical protein
MRNFFRRHTFNQFTLFLALGPFSCLAALPPCPAYAQIGINDVTFGVHQPKE